MRRLVIYRYLDNVVYNFHGYAKLATLITFHTLLYMIVVVNDVMIIIPLLILVNQIK